MKFYWATIRFIPMNQNFSSIFRILIICNLFSCLTLNCQNFCICSYNFFILFYFKGCLFKMYIYLSVLFAYFLRFDWWVDGWWINIWICSFFSDEIMQLDTNPPRAADITPDLRKQFAFLSGDSFMFLSSLCAYIYICGLLFLSNYLCLNCV